MRCPNGPNDCLNQARRLQVTTCGGCDPIDHICKIGYRPNMITRQRQASPQLVEQMADAPAGSSLASNSRKRTADAALHQPLSMILPPLQTYGHIIPRNRPPTGQGESLCLRIFITLYNIILINNYNIWVYWICQ